ncbi:MAG: hypothetical protein C3F06_01035 [Candidatus Methanoperedenaceae archaeon]|nr:MAG: hypothetical protein C3F06_01035 [Candidatus Methanoperedenaceae archaeon]
MLKILYPDLVKDIKFPKGRYKPKILSNKEQLQTFYNALPDIYNPVLFLLAEFWAKELPKNILSMNENMRCPILFHLL